MSSAEIGQSVERRTTVVLSALLLFCSFAWRRPRLREVEAEVVAPGDARRAGDTARLIPAPTILHPEPKPSPRPVLAEVAPAPEEPSEPKPPTDEEEEAGAAEASADVAPALDEEEVDDEEEVEAAAAAPADLPVPLESPPLDPPSLSTAEWSCEIALWAEGNSAVFYARSFHRGDEIVVAESPPFPTRGDGDPERGGGALKAHAALTEELVRAGWIRAGGGSEWYADRFRRDFDPAAVTASLKTRVLFAGRS